MKAEPQIEPSVSVIIPTFRDWDRLSLCLDKLEAQTFPARLTEIIVVNNDPQDVAPARLVLRSNTRLITETLAGSYAARNAGIAAASGDVLAFTDSDCIPDERWLETGVHRLQSGAERVAGHVQLFTESGRPSLADHYELMLGFDQKHYVSLGTAATANMMTWSHHFTHVGPFDSSLLSGGDMEWGLRAQRLGVTITYAPDCVVRHPTRASIGALFGKARRVAGGQSTLRGILRPRHAWLRSILPPKSVQRILSARKPPLHIRLQVAALAYALKLWSTLHTWLLSAGVSRPRRA